MAEEKISRRKFLSYSAVGIATAVLAALAYPLGGFAIAPALRKLKGHWIAVGKINRFRVGEPTNAEFSFHKTDAWFMAIQKDNVWVVAKGGGEFNVFNPHCTHLGCAYHWDDIQKKFICPCHGGVFDINGKVLAGPPPRPLDRVEHKVENGELLVREA